MIRPYLAIIRDSFRSVIASYVLYVILILIAISLLILAPLRITETVSWKMLWTDVESPQRLVSYLVEKGSTGKDKRVAHVWDQLSDSLQKDLKSAISDEKKTSTRPSAPKTSANKDDKSNANATREPTDETKTEAETKSEPTDSNQPNSKTDNSGDQPSDQDQTSEPALDPTASEPSHQDAARGMEASAGVMDSLLGELNVLLTKRDFYQEEIFPTRRLSPKVHTLLEEGVDNLSDLKVKRLNRLLLDSAFKRRVKPATDVQLDWYYLHWHLEMFTANLTSDEFSALVRGLFGTYGKWVMSIGILVALLVTSTIIPEMLEAGSINLLLSKPVYRWGLLLTKFIGGCALIFLCASLFFVGLYLWLGIQLKTWDSSLLISIPVYVVVFAMYYSVSVLAGLLFRSPILSVVFAILFWVACFAVGVTYGQLNAIQSNVAEKKLLATDHELFMFDILQQGHRWSDDGWEPIMDEHKSEEEKALGVAANFISIETLTTTPLDQLADFPSPVFSPTEQRLFTGNAGIHTMMLGSVRYDFVSANEQNSWQRNKLGRLPSGTTELFFDEGKHILAVTDDMEVHEFTIKSPPTAPPTDEPSSETAETKATKTRSRRIFESVSDIPKRTILRHTAVDFNPARHEFACYSEGTLSVVHRNDEQTFVPRGEQMLAELDNTQMTAFVSYRGDALLVGLGNGKLYQLDPESLEVIHTGEVDRQMAILNMEMSADGKYAAIVLKDGTLKLYDTETQQFVSAGSIGDQGDITAVSFDLTNRLWTINRFRDTTAYSLPDQSVEVENAVELAWLSWAFRKIVRPLYYVFPKPGEFYKVVEGLSTVRTPYDEEVDLTKKSQTYDPWEPLRSGFIFTAIVLAFSCFIFQRKDF